MPIKSLLQSENSRFSVTLSNSDSDEVSLEEQEPSSSAVPNEFMLNGSYGSDQKNIPWMRRKYYPNVLSLHDEVFDLYLWLKPTAEEIFLRRSVFNRVADILKSIYPNAQVFVFGSVATNLFLPSSDIDIVINLSNFTIECLHNVAEKFRLMTNNYENVITIDRSYVPIVKLIEKNTRFHIDISFNTHSVVLKTVAWVEQKKHNVPQLEPLVLVLKQFLSQRGLNQPFNGGLSSYALILMVYSFIKIFKSSNIGNPKTIFQKNCLGVLLYNFFHYYGYVFNYSESAIRVRDKQPTVILKDELAKEMNEYRHTSIFFIEDPVQNYNNVGKGAHNMMAIKAAFAHAYDLIFSGIMQCNCYDPEFIRTYYCGPMLSLIVSFREDEINYRMMLRNAIIINNDLCSRSSNSRNSVSPIEKNTQNNNTIDMLCNGISKLNGDSCKEEFLLKQKEETFSRHL